MPCSLEQLYSTFDHEPDPAQKEAIGSTKGPLRILAGPGSGKTHVLVLRTLNLLACQEVDPSRIAVVTFTEKAAEQLEDRIRLYSSRLPTTETLPIAELQVGTIHWLCGAFLRRYHPSFRQFETLDELGQKLFIYDHLDDIFDDVTWNGRRLGKWQSKSKTVHHVIPWFNKVTEQTVDWNELQASDDRFLSGLGQAYARYRTLLHEEGYLDFGGILRELHDLLDNDPEAREAARSQLDYIMVDEYQDTNFIQEELLLDLAAPSYNIAVVGDDDQSLYRFRGAEVRNIVEFPDRLAEEGRETEDVELSINYRSHPGIISSYMNFVEEADWTKGDREFRTGHRVVADPKAEFEDYTPALYLEGGPEVLADLVEDLLERGAVEDPNQIALLFHSVASHGLPVVEELQARDIPCYAPRARKYLDHPEVQAAVGVLWGIGRFPHGEGPDGGPVGDTCNWARECYEDLAKREDSDKLIAWLEERRSEYDHLERGEDLKASLLDVVYQALRYQPLRRYVEDPVASRNLGHFTTLLRTFQQQFGFDVLHAGNRRVLPWRLWTSFFYLMRQTGLDDVESEDGPPPGLIQVSTIHQAKGLEFPVVVVGSLEKRPRTSKEIDRVLGPYYPRGRFEPEDRITEFDRRRLLYVGFSRAQHLMVAYSNGDPHRYCESLTKDLPAVDEADLSEIVERIPEEPPRSREQKPVLSLTGDVNAYRRCSRQYRFFKNHGFSPSFAAQVFFGSVVHQTIEDIHRHVLDERQDPLTEDLIEFYFVRNSEILRKRGVHPLAPNQREEALKHVLRYFRSNRDRLDRVEDTEVEVSLEEKDYVLGGRVDLIRGSDGGLELVDFKAQKRPDHDTNGELDAYKDQLAFYYHLLKERLEENAVRRTVLYFTGEEEPERAWMNVDVRQERIQDVVNRFDKTARQILAEDYALRSYPSRKTCRACDFKHYCKRTGSDLN